MKIKNYKIKNNGFTLIELMVVLSIIVIIGAMIEGLIFGALDQRSKRYNPVNNNNARTTMSSPVSVQFTVGQTVYLKNFDITGVIDHIEDNNNYGILYKLSNGELKGIVVNVNQISIK
jgi:prepilin-type N-terminal cleavage/methylation domain-containing protein